MTLKLSTATFAIWVSKDPFDYVHASVMYTVSFIFDPTDMQMRYAIYVTHEGREVDKGVCTGDPITAEFAAELLNQYLKLNPPTWQYL